MRKVFPWIACARRRLTIDEINEAYAIDATDTRLYREKVPTDHKRILEACGSLILFDKDDRTVSFAHNTVKQFLIGSTNTSELVGSLQFKLDEAEFRIGEACVTYLSFSDFETQLIRAETTTMPIHSNLVQGAVTQIPFGKTLYSIGSKISEGFGFVNRLPPKPFVLSLPTVGPPSGELEERYHLLNYIVHNWHWHTSQFTPDKPPSIWAKFKTLALQRQLPFNIRPWESLSGKTIPEEHKISNLKLFQWAATDPDRAIFLRLWDCNAGNTDLKPYLDHEAAAGRNLFTHAIKNGYYTLVQLLIQRGEADVELEDSNHERPLHLAVETGQIAIVKLLMSKGADVNAQGGYHGNALQAASLRGNLAVVKLLLSKGADVNTQGGNYGSPLRAALANRHQDIAELLLSKGANLRDIVK
jgi:hypothetical protein